MTSKVPSSFKSDPVLTISTEPVWTGRRCVYHVENNDVSILVDLPPKFVCTMKGSL